MLVLCDFSNEELVALLRDATVTPAAIADEMTSAGASAATPAQLEVARVVLDTFTPDQAEAFANLPVSLRGPLLDQAVAAQAASFVTAVCASNDKAVVKEAKRALHRLRAGGLKVEPPRPAAAPPAKAPEEELVGYMSSIDGAHGERLVFHPCPVPGGIDVAQIILSDEWGISNADLAPLDRKGFRRFVEKLGETQTLLVGAVPRAYSRSLIARALDRNAVARRPVPAGFNDVAFAIGPAPAPQASPGRTLALPQELAFLATEAQATRLLTKPQFDSWAPPDSVRTPLRAVLDTIAKSTLYIDEQQRGTASLAARRDAIIGFWTTELRRVWAERLFDMAWLMAGAGDAQQRDLALASAHQLEGDAPLESVGFAWALFRRLT